jgi:hypothetical protein
VHALRRWPVARRLEDTYVTAALLLSDLPSHDPSRRGHGARPIRSPRKIRFSDGLFDANPHIWSEACQISSDGSLATAHRLPVSQIVAFIIGHVLITEREDLKLKHRAIRALAALDFRKLGNDAPSG